MARTVSRKQFSVYTLAYPDGTVFCVGKGTGDRIEAHLQEARGKTRSRKCDIIRQIWSAVAPSQIASTLKGITARQVFKQFPEIKVYTLGVKYPRIECGGLES